MADGLKVDFAEIDRMANSLTQLNAYAGPLVPKVGALVGDSDLLASAILSPGTAAAAEAAIVRASAGLGVTVVQTEAMTIITVSIVKTYEVAEQAIAAAAAQLVAVTVKVEKFAADVAATTVRIGVDVALAAKSVGYFGILVGTLAVESVRTGVAQDLLGVTGQSFLQAARDALVDGHGNAADTFVLFATGLGHHFVANFNAALPEMSPKIVAMAQNSIGDLRAHGMYDDLLGTIIADGHRFGMFDDGDPYFVTDVLGDDERLARTQDALSDSEGALGEHLGVDADGNVIPTDVASLFASSAQIDGIGQDDFADIRIFKTVGADGVTRYTVQIPSTQSWDPHAGVTPNDFTSDVMAMRYGNDTALSNAVMRAMEREGITDQPVMLVGFSLGGITAGAIAADPHGYNIQQVVTAGSPIGAMDIPSSTHVTSFEATSDPVASLDGTLNPDRASWQTVRGDAVSMPADAGKDPTLVNAHNADRYAVMAQGNPSVNGNPDIAQFLGGGGNQTTVNDWEVSRTQ